jgi:hypothetical protein
MFKKLFAKKSSDAKGPIYRFLDVDYSELDQYPDGIDRLQNGDHHGFIIRNVFSKEEVDSIVSNYLEIPSEELNEVNNGMIMYPAPFSLIDQSSENSRDKLNEYYRGTEIFWNNFPNQFGVDFVERCQTTITKMASGRTARTPVGEDGIGSYHPATFKHLVPGKGEFKAHCGNYFHREFPTFYAHMKAISTIRNQMSYFVMLKPSESGGELTLYDVSWEQAEIRHPGDVVLEAPDGKLYDLLDEKQVKRDYLKPGPGDMIVFSGGRIWHKVEVAQGSERYTIGGFMSIAKDDQSIYLWS